MTSKKTTTPPCLRWAHNFHHLLADVDGVELFANFLQEEHLEDVLHFYFAVKGLRDQRKTLRPEKLHQLAKLIFKKYLRDTDGVLTALLPAETKRTIQRKLTNKGTTTTTTEDEEARKEGTMGQNQVILRHQKFTFPRARE